MRTVFRSVELSESLFWEISEQRSTVYGAGRRYGYHCLSLTDLDAPWD